MQEIVLPGGRSRTVPDGPGLPGCPPWSGEVCRSWCRVAAGDLAGWRVSFVRAWVPVWSGVAPGLAVPPPPGRAGSRSRVSWPGGRARAARSPALPRGARSPADGDPAAGRASAARPSGRCRRGRRRSPTGPRWRSSAPAGRGTSRGYTARGARLRPRRPASVNPPSADRPGGSVPRTVELPLQSPGDLLSPAIKVSTAHLSTRRPDSPGQVRSPARSGTRPSSGYRPEPLQLKGRTGSGDCR